MPSSDHHWLTACAGIYVSFKKTPVLYLPEKQFASSLMCCHLLLRAGLVNGSTCFILHIGKKKKQHAISNSSSVHTAQEMKGCHSLLLKLNIHFFFYNKMMVVACSRSDIQFVYCEHYHQMHWITIMHQNFRSSVFQKDTVVLRSP